MQTFSKDLKQWLQAAQTSITPHNKMQKWEIRVYKESCSDCFQGQPNRNQSSLRKHKILDIEG